MSCSAPPSLRIVRGQVGETHEPVTGVNVRVMQPTLSDYAGMKAGFHIVRSEESWRAIWERPQRLPVGVDFGRAMIFAVAGDTSDLASVRVQRLVDAENTLHLFVKEVRRGQNCVKSNEPTTFDVAIADRVDKPLVVHVEVSEAPSCGQAPLATAFCRVDGASEFKRELTATPGDLVECSAEVAVRGKFAVIERTWQLEDIPKGSAAKLSHDVGAGKVWFMTDVFGRYAIRYDVVDDAGRRTKADAIVNIPPPKTDNPFVQLAWAGFDASDDPQTFPRVYLVAMRANDATECSTKMGTPHPPWCEVKSQPTVHNMRLGTGGGIGDVPLFVHYTDDRYEGSPFVCVRTFFNGSKTAEICDKVRRDAGTMWRPGTLDARTGTLVPPLQDSADAGAGADASAAAVSPKKPLPKR